MIYQGREIAGLLDFFKRDATVILGSSRWTNVRYATPGEVTIYAGHWYLATINIEE